MVHTGAQDREEDGGDGEQEEATDLVAPFYLFGPDCL